MEIKEIRKNKIELIIAIIGIFAALFGVIMFNKFVVTGFPYFVRLIMQIIIQWGVAIVPIILMYLSKEKFTDLGFKKENILKQIKIGILAAFSMSIVLTVIPIFFGGKNFIVGNILNKRIYQYIYQLIYMIFGIALMEEFIFRGYIFNKILSIKHSRKLAIILSSILFGVFHIFNGNLFQVVFTTIIGIILCMFREKVKNCSIISLIVCHGVYDWLIIVWGAIL